MKKTTLLFNTSNFLTKQDISINFHTSPYSEFHSHTFFEFHIQTHGSVIHHYENKYEKIKTGDIILISPSLSHSYIADPKSKNGSKYLNLAISTNFFTNLISFLGIANFKTFIDDMELLMQFHISSASVKHLYKQYNELETYENKQSQDYFLSLKFYLINLLSLIYNISSSTFSTKPKWLINFLNILENPDNYQLSVQELLKHSFYSPSHLAFLFKKHMGVTIHEYICSKKMERASFLLKNTDYKITEIAIQLGYSEQGHFSYLFKQKYKYTPFEYRKKFSTKK